ncbi:carbohydrate kinase family protein [Aquicella lusitana]|uniref:Pseudouridine kinase n=1 Tax=Aquicella lusitana TaxID=254246 RepID=A0A370GSV9_9COXI|nr:carbohydrate kinase family protein [Aquicella lusitana]RDI46571.1 pseudouridine kinase [Aquicella lusitana]VVC74235.1 Pseudouridine kinase [Aquicella lusitana]
MKKIFCLGGATIDHKLKSSASYLLGTSNPVSSITTFGGVARNIAENLGRWSKEIHLQCAVGNDRDGRQLLAHMQSLGVDTDGSLVLENASTAHYYAALAPDGELFIALADMEIYNQVQLDSFTPAWERWTKNSLIFIDTNLPVTIIDEVIQRCRHRQLPLCIDPVSVAKAGKLAALELEGVFLIKPNQLEAGALTDMEVDSVRKCIHAGCRLLDKGVKNVVISLGKAGWVIVNEYQQQHFEGIELCDIHDVNGAGDAFIAGILYGLQQQANLEEACYLGASAATLTLKSCSSVAQGITAKHLKSLHGSPV